MTLLAQMVTYRQYTRMLIAILLQWGTVTYGQVGVSEREKIWVDSIVATLSPDEKIAQLLVIPVSASNPVNNVNSWIQRNHPGAILVTGGTENTCRKMLREFQSEAPIPLLVAMQSDWGPGQVLDSSLQIPKPMILAAAGSDSLAFIAGRLIAKKLLDIGIHISISVNADTDVPNVGSLASARYYSNDPEVMRRIAGAMIRGMKREGVLPVLKHLPGDKETELIDIYKSRLNLISGEEDSFRIFLDLLNTGADGLLTSWLHYTVRSGTRTEPAAFSERFLSKLIRDNSPAGRLLIAETSFISQLQPQSKQHAARTAFALGYDLIIVDKNPAQALDEIRQLVRNNQALKDELDERVRRVLTAKFKAGLTKIGLSSPWMAQATHRVHVLNGVIREKAVTVVRNSANRIPVRKLNNRRFYYIRFGESTVTSAAKMSGNYAPFADLLIRNVRDTVLLKDVQPDDVVVTEHTDSDEASLSKLSKWLTELDRKCQLVVIHYGNPNELVHVKDCSTVIEGYDAPELGTYVPQVIFGGLSATGRMPVNAEFLPKSLIQTEKMGRLSFGFPEQVGMSSLTLEQIDSVVWGAIQDGATPGARVLAVRHGRVVLDRSYGWHTYEKTESVSPATIYDLASVTKVTATLQAVMHLYDKGKIDLEKKASAYLPELRGTNKNDFTIRDILTHQAGLWPFLPFWARTMKDSTWMMNFYSTEKKPGYELPVSENLFAANSMRDSLWAWILRAKISEQKDREPFRYKYSDMGFYILQRLSERLLNKSLDEFLQQEIYEPIGAVAMSYLPLRRFPASSIAPTEDDRLFRKSLLRGYVHDQGAAMHGGVAGHAGLFGTALDLAKMGQMWLQEGTYGDDRFFQPSTLQLFTRRQFRSSRRGLGWDKPAGGSEGPTSASASAETFGHTGFTGTCIWVDPEHELVYVFLSNRVHPDMNNNKLISGNIRPRVQEVLYRAIKAFEVENHSLF